MIGLWSIVTMVYVASVFQPRAPIDGSSAAGGLFLPVEVEIHARKVVLQPYTRGTGVALHALEPRDAGG